MPSGQLNITLIQTDIVWEDVQANLQHYEQLLDGIQDKKEIVVFPEMFTTGFSMAPERLAESMDGPSVSWMKGMAAKHRCIITGSLIIKDGNNFYNRLLWVLPNGQEHHYDKRHLFGYGEEDKHYTPGDKRLIVQVNGWRICLMVCYDLRFPAWARNQGGEYDVLMYVANWPEKRSIAWKTLLHARAIENMCYTVGVNRIGTDGKEIHYAGDSSVFGPLGEIVWRKTNEAAVHTITLEKNAIENARAHFPFLNDADKFLLL
ncbi:MAG: amidohydrolase [Taibaiella sp.]|nr:amidohydrolase [Taibaiella sp.]